MKEINNIILEMIKENKSINEIVECTGISHKRLFYRLSLLKLKGFNFDTKYYYSGDIAYQMINSLTNEKEEGTTILTSKNDVNFKAMVISDLHFGNSLERLDLLNEIYNYCIKEGINIIINAGDLIDGTFSSTKQKINSCEEQIEYTIKNYPFDKSILNFVCLGDHDYSSVENTGQDLALALQSRRHDIIPIGYGIGIINIKNDRIYIQHPKTSNFVKTINDGLILSGHSHASGINISQATLIQIPSLSNLKPQNRNVLPGAIVLNINFINGFFNYLSLNNLIIANNKIYEAGTFDYYIGKGKNISSNFINNEEERNNSGKEKVKTLNNQNNRLSQIDKFNKRYNR